MELSKDELVELKADSMDDSEIKMQDKDIKIIVYNDLKDYKTIDELLPKGTIRRIVVPYQQA